MSELHDRLTALGADARWPATPDLAPRVRTAVAGGGRAGRGGRLRAFARAGTGAGRGGRLRIAFAGAGRGRRLRIAFAGGRAGAVRGRLAVALARPWAPMRERRPAATVLVGAVIALVVAGSLATAPGVRSALLRSLGLEHAQVTRVERLPRTTLGTRLALGERHTLAAARKRAGFELRSPARLGTPDEVYIDRGAVTFVYGERSGRLILFQQVPGSARPYVEKLAQSFERVHVDGVPGLLVKGPHVTIFDQRPGGHREEPSRLAKTTLLWERHGLLLRLEADLPGEDLLRIARSVR